MKPYYTKETSEALLALERLEEMGLIEKVGGRYRITNTGRKVCEDHFGEKTD